jgi:hypothetical protein
MRDKVVNADYAIITRDGRYVAAAHFSGDRVLTDKARMAKVFPSVGVAEMYAHQYGDVIEPWLVTHTRSEYVPRKLLTIDITALARLYRAARYLIGRLLGGYNVR